MAADPKPTAGGAVNAPLKSVVVEVRGPHWATSKAVIERVLLRQSGVAAVDANPVSQTATVKFDPSLTSVEQIAGWVRDCGYHCRGESVPDHVCYPMGETLHATGMTRDVAPVTEARGSSGHVHPEDHRRPEHVGRHGVHEGQGPVPADPGTGHADPAASEHAGHGAMPRTPQDVMGHGGHHPGMSMDNMVKDMRNRFLVAAVLSIGVTLWSPMGRDMFGFTAPTPFGSVMT